MAQVYAFTDQNGETRLFAEIHPDPAGTPFNGGTITNGLEIDAPTGTEALKIVSVDGNSTKMIDAVAVHTTFTVDSDGTVVMSSDDGMGVQVSASGGTHASLSVSESPSGAAATLSSTAGIIYNDGSVNTARLGSTVFLLHLNAAPADGELVAGDCALWFDRTNGAGKLMVKAKTANGTVVTGSVALA